MSKEYIIWIITYLMGTWYVYSYGMKKALKEIRLKNGLMTPTNEEIYDKEIGILRKRDFFGSFCEIIFWTSFIVLGVIAIFYKCASLDFNDLAGIIMSLIFVIITLTAFIDSPIDEEEFEGKSKLEILGKLFTFIKGRILERVASKELNKLKRKNKKLIKMWFRNDDKRKMASLVEKLNNNTFLKLLPSDISEASKEELQVNCKSIAEVFLENYQDLYIELKILFNQNLLDLGINICDISIYLYEHDEYPINENLKKIENRISNKVKVKKTKTKKTTIVNNIRNIDELESMVESVTGTEQ